MDNLGVHVHAYELHKLKNFFFAHRFLIYHIYKLELASYLGILVVPTRSMQILWSIMTREIGALNPSTPPLEIAPSPTYININNYIPVSINIDFRQSIFFFIDSECRLPFAYCRTQTSVITIIIIFVRLQRCRKRSKDSVNVVCLILTFIPCCRTLGFRIREFTSTTVSNVIYSSDGGGTYFAFGYYNVRGMRVWRFRRTSP